MTWLQPLLLRTICLAVLSSCATEPPRAPHGTFSVKVVPFFGKKVPVYIAAYAIGDGQRGRDLLSFRVTGDGITGFVLPMGRAYGVRAYADLDGDGQPGPGDPAARVEGLKPISDLSAHQEPVVLTLPGRGAAPDWPQKKAAPAAQIGPLKADEVKKGIDKLRSAAPELPIPPLPAPSRPK